MKLTFYKNVSDRRVLNKSLTQIVVYNNAVFLSDSSIINPVFDLVIDTSIIGEINYCYCDVLKRYYFINDITATSGGRFIVKCHVDVLNTYKTEILNTRALIHTQTSHANVLLNNPIIPSQSNEQIINLKFSDSEFTTSGISDNFVLTCYRGDNNAI